MKPFPSALLCLGLACPAFAHASNWIATQLSYTPNGWGVGQVIGLNNSGQVLGLIDPPPSPYPWPVEAIPMAFMTGANGSNLQPISPSYDPYPEYCHGCNTHSTPIAINDAGQVTMFHFNSWAMEMSVSLAGPSGGSIAPLPGAESALGVKLSINNSGQVAGTYYNPAGSFVTGANGSNPQPLSMLDYSYDNWVHSINDGGQLLVSGVLNGSSEYKTFVTNTNATGVAFESGTFGYESWASGLNNSAQVFGGYKAIAGGESRAFITGVNGIGFTDIGSLSGPTFANAISNTGMVVGTSGGTPFVYGFKGGDMRDLNQLIALAPGELFIDAPDINDRGQIIAGSNFGNMYLLSPVPEPATYVMLAGGLALIGWRTRNHAYVSRETAA